MHTHAVLDFCSQLEKIDACATIKTWLKTKLYTQSFQAVLWYLKYVKSENKGMT